MVNIYCYKNYEEELDENDRKIVKLIREDVHRTLPTSSLFKH